jgi:hypothetical protein
MDNPYARSGLEHAGSKAPITSVRNQEAEVMRPLGEIEVLVNEVEA